MAYGFGPRAARAAFGPRAAGAAFGPRAFRIAKLLAKPVGVRAASLHHYAQGFKVARTARLAKKYAVQHWVKGKVLGARARRMGG